MALAASSLCAPAAAAVHYEIFNGVAWTQNGTTTFIGPSTSTVAGIPISCSNTTITIDVAGGTAHVQGISFSGSTACSWITGQTLPWPMSPPMVASFGGAEATVYSFSLKYTQPPATCTGKMTIKFGNVNPYIPPNPSTLTFTSVVGVPCTNFKSTGTFYATKPLRIMP